MLVNFIDGQWECAVSHRELNLVLCVNLEGCNGMGGGREVQAVRDISTVIFLLVHGRNQHNTVKQLPFN